MMSIDIPKKKWADILCVVSGKNQKNVVDESGTYPIYGSGGIIGYANDYICEAGTTIIGRKGTINNPIFVNERFWNVDTAFGISPGEELLPEYLYYFCRQFNFASLDKSTTIPSLAKRDLLAIEMPVPPILEQKRIVARIEELFSELDNGVETLRKTKQQLAVYRQAVLVEAFNAISGSVDMEALATMIDPQPSHRTPPEIDNGIPYIGIGDINYNTQEIDFEKSRKVSSSVLAEQQDRYALYPGDFVMGKIGTIGKPFRLSLPQNYTLSANVILIHPNSKLIKPEFLFWQFSSPLVTRQLALGSTATSQPAFGIKKARKLQIKLCSLEKQELILQKIQEKMSLCDNIERTVDTALQQAEAMRQSILKQAFEGSLYA